MQKQFKRAIQNNKQTFLYYQQIKSIFIQAQTTPNPNFLKFIPSGKKVMKDGGTHDFVQLRDTQISPLARKLMTIEGINRVFYGPDFISISKKEETEWQLIKPQIYGLITDFYNKDEELFSDKPQAEDTKINEEDSETVQAIKEILDSRIRPVVQDDGGDIQFINFDEETGVVKLIMKGSCSGCPSSGHTLKNGIEKMLKHYVAEVESVVAEDYKGTQQ